MNVKSIQCCNPANTSCTKNNFTNTPSFGTGDFKGIYSSLNEVKSDLKEVSENFKLGQIIKKGFRTLAQKASDELAKLAKDKELPPKD